MPFEAEQRSFADEPTRLFLMRARMFGVPVQAFHRLIGGSATMRVSAVGVVPIVNDGGDRFGQIVGFAMSDHRLAIDRMATPRRRSDHGQI